MARKSKRKVTEQPPVDDGDATEEESVRDNDNMQEESDDDIPSTVDKDCGDEDDGEAVEKPKETKKKSDKKSKSKGTKNKNDTIKAKEAMPFMDTFYQLSSEDSPMDRSVAARDLIHHCFLTGHGINHKDAAYALTRLMNGLCTNRAASRQGFASCLSSFLRVGYSSSVNENDGRAMEEILQEDDYSKKLKEEAMEDDVHPAMIILQKLLGTTEFIAPEVESKNKGKKKNRNSGKLKGMEERDHVFGRLFGILAVVRSGILGLKDFPSVVVEGYTKNLIELYHYKNFMREPSANALVELLSSLDAESNLNMITKLVTDVITPTFFLSASNNSAENGNTLNGTDSADRAQWLQKLTPEQIAVALHLQTLQNDHIKYGYPLDEPIVTAESIPTLSSALTSTSSTVYPRCHFVWNTLWMYLTDDSKSQGRRQLRANEEFPLIIEKIIQHVVVDTLLGKGEESSAPTNERRSLALQVISALSGSSDLQIALPPNLIASVICPDVVQLVFVNVLCSGDALWKKNARDGGAESYLKPLTSQALVGLTDHCCEDDNVSRRMAFAKAFLLAEPRFDKMTKTETVSSFLMLGNNAGETSKEFETQKAVILQSYLSFLEEEIVSGTSLHNATVYIELMYKLAKRDLAKAPANDARRVVRFFMSGAFFDCLDLSVPSAIKKSSSKKKKKDKTEAASVIPPQELSAGFHIKEILQANGMSSISYPVRAIMSARFYSLLSEFTSVKRSPNREGKKDNAFYGKGSNPDSIYRALSEICGISPLLETSGAKQFPVVDASLDADDATDPMEVSRKLMLTAQNIANDALVKECDGSGDKELLRAKAVFTTSCASLMMSLYLQLNSCGNPDSDDNEEEEDDVIESVHEYISDLAECVEGFCQIIENESSFKKDDEGNPLATMAGLLVNILYSPVGGEGSGKTNPIQASASKLTRETVKLTWTGIISVITGLNAKNKSLKSLIDEDVMSILIESVCGDKSIGNEGNDEDDEESDSSEDDLGDSAVFVDASNSGMDLDAIKDDTSDASKESDDESSKDGDDKDVDEDIELDPSKLENLLLEDSDAEMSDGGVFGVLEHHAGADKALAQLIKMKQEARKASQVERERVELCNRLRCAGLLDALFSEPVFRSGWLPIEAVLGSIVPILRSCRAIEKSIQASKKSLSERNALLDRLIALTKDKISKFRCSDNSEAEELALKASSDIYEEMKSSPNVDHRSCCSVALITAMRCIPRLEDNNDVKAIYVGAVDDWSSRKATKISARMFDDLIERMPSLASLILMEPLMTAARGAHSPFLKCESIKLLSAIYKHDGVNADDPLQKKASSSMKDYSGKVAETLKHALGDSSLEKKRRDEVLGATKHFVNYAKDQDEGILTEVELCALQETLKTVGDSCKSAGMKQLCSQVSDTISGLARKEKLQPVKIQKVPKSSKKKKKSKK